MKRRPTLRRMQKPFPGFEDLKDHHEEVYDSRGHGASLLIKTFQKGTEGNGNHLVTGLFDREGNPLARIEHHDTGVVHAWVHPDAKGHLVASHADGASKVSPGQEIIYGDMDASKSRRSHFYVDDWRLAKPGAKKLPMNVLSDIHNRADGSLEYRHQHLSGDPRGTHVWHFD